MAAGFADRNQTVVEKTINGETYEQIYTQMLKPVPMDEWEKLPEDEKALAKPYPFNPHTYEAAPGIICEQDVAVEMRDGIKLYCDIYRPATSGEDEKTPVILAWSNYGKRPNEYRTGKDIGFTPGVPEGTISPMAKFETVDPTYWCNNGYAVINVDIRGVGFSEGYHDSSASRTVRTATTSSSGLPSSRGATARLPWPALRRSPSASGTSPRSSRLTWPASLRGRA